MILQIATALKFRNKLSHMMNNLFVVSVKYIIKYHCHNMWSRLGTGNSTCTFLIHQVRIWLSLFDFFLLGDR